MGNCMQKVDLKKNNVNNKFKKVFIIVDGIQINNNSEVSQCEKLRKEPFVPSEDVEDNYIWLSLSITNKDFEKHQGFSLDSFAENIIDPVGSGDALLSYSTLAMLSTSNLLAASILGSIAAACACEKDGNTTVTPNEVVNKINFIQKKLKLI